jgi:hypothetical protein
LFFILILSGQIIGFINIKVTILKISAIIQTVIIMLIVAAAAAGCSAGKEYANRVFGSKTAAAKDSASVRFLETDSTDEYENGTVYIKIEKAKADTVVKKEPEQVTESPAPPATTSNNGTRTKRKRSGE